MGDNLYFWLGTKPNYYNACYSEVQSQEIAKYINYVIRMSQAIDDRISIEFFVAFYEALAADQT